MKKPEHYYKEVSEELGESTAIIKEIYNFYWKEGIKDPLKKLEHSSIFIKNIGTITVSKYKLYREIRFFIRKLRMLKFSQKFTPEKKLVIEEKYKGRLRALLKRRNELIKEGTYDR